jgi:hypothetical protein
VKNKIVWVLLITVIVLGGILRFSGFEWGIPREPYWRNHYQDEAFVLGLLFKMGPDNLNPHYFINPTFHYYTLLAAVKAATIFGYIKPFSIPVATNRLGQPAGAVSLADYGRMYRVGRLLTVLESIILIYLVFLIGCNLYNRKTGLIAAALTAVVPAAVFQSHFLVVDAPAVFWFVLAFWFLTIRVEPAALRRWSVFCGIFIGLAVGTKYTNILLVPPFLYRLYQLNAAPGPFLKKMFSRYFFYAGLTALGLFFFTTPYALLSFREFLQGDAQGFGGIFGSRGLFYYNAYPLNILTPFSLATLQSLQLPLAVAALAGIIFLCLKRRPGDLMLLLFILPFYVMLIDHASPHLRHVLPVLPFLMIGVAAATDGFMTRTKVKLLKAVVMVLLVGVYVYTLLFSLAVMGRMTKVDTRIECAEWVKANIPADATVGLASYFPWNYTPPVENALNPEKIAITGYSYDNVLAHKCEYFIITEYEYREFAYAREGKYAARKFVNDLFSQRDYQIIKEFKKDFSVFGIKFNPHFPNLDWNPVNPRIYVFRLKS